MHSTMHMEKQNNIDKVCFPETIDKHPQSGVCYVGYTVIKTACDGIGKYERRTKKSTMVLN